MHIPDPVVSSASGARSRARGAAGRLGRACVARRARAARRPPSGWRSSCTTCSPSRSTRSRRSSGARRPRRASSRAVAGGASRRRRPRPIADLTRQREVVDAFFAAARARRLRAARRGARPRRRLALGRGPARTGHVARGARGRGRSRRRALTFARLAPCVRPVLVNGAAGVVVAPEGRPFSVMGFTVARRPHRRDRRDHRPRAPEPDRPRVPRRLTIGGAAERVSGVGRVAGWW